LVFAAFSGSHQDAIAKGVKFREERGQKTWNVPYLPIDPTDVGCVYEADVIRINSQSGKGGVGYIMESQFNLVLPPKMREAFSYKVKSVSDHEHRELLPKEIYDYFVENYVNIEAPVSVLRAVYVDRAEGILADCRIRTSLGECDVVGLGNGRLDAVSNALKEKLGLDYTLDSYTQHALEGKTTSEAASYVSIVSGGKTYFGTGIDKDIVVSGVKALVSAVNILLEDR
jgi:2-isopropylmalate synthase